VCLDLCVCVYVCMYLCACMCLCMCAEKLSMSFSRYSSALSRHERTKCVLTCVCVYVSVCVCVFDGIVLRYCAMSV
jgi:hypothetical protein